MTRRARCIHVVIDEVSLPGVSAAQAEVILREFKQELARQLSAPAMAPALEQGNHTASVTGNIAGGQARRSTAAPLGAQMAARIGEVLLK